MIEKLKQDLKEHMNRLPKESQEVIASFGWEKISEEIGKKYFLIEDDINMLQANIGCVLVGLEEQDELAFNIEDDVGTSNADAYKMTEEIIEKILKPMVDILAQKIKKDFKDSEVDWQQNLDFILSGGDYTVFLSAPEPIQNTTPNPVEKSIEKPRSNSINPIEIGPAQNPANSTNPSEKEEKESKEALLINFFKNNKWNQ